MDPIVPPNPRMKVSQLIAADFRQRIARGELQEGEALPIEDDLVEQIGVSKVIVREALRILETEGLVEVRRGFGGGPRVRHPSIAQAASAMGVYLQIGDVLVMDVYDARDRMIRNAIERLATGRSGEEAAELAATVEQLEAVAGEIIDFYPTWLDVGDTAVRVAGNATEHVVVLALRHIIAAELEAARRVSDLQLAALGERAVAQAWTETSRCVTEGRPYAALRAYSSQADLIRMGLARAIPPTTVVDIFRNPEIPEIERSR
jgi:DNA-binding FadR family transcriptional regulator